MGRPFPLIRANPEKYVFFPLMSSLSLSAIFVNMRTIYISPSIKGEKLSAENLRMVNGVSGGLEALAWIISDPGDLVIVPTPTYARWMM